LAEKFLIPLDGSVLGESALHYVEGMISRLKPREKPEIILLHVINPEPYIVSTSFSIEPYSPQEIEKAKNAALTYLKNAASILEDKGFTVSYKVIRGKVVDEIVKAETELGADLVAISTHGHSGIGHWAFGNITEKIMHTGTLPVLVVRAKNAAV
jgi:nucleotide-binding universal stress UspA family protein